MHPSNQAAHQGSGMVKRLFAGARLQHCAVCWPPATFPHLAAHSAVQALCVGRGRCSTTRRSCPMLGHPKGAEEGALT